MARVSVFVTCVLWVVVGRASSQTGLSDSEKQELLDTHNRLRSIVNPPASIMPDLVWSDELATIAQNYAQQCIYKHNDDRSQQSETYSYVGENLLATDQATPDYTFYVEFWDSEKKDYDYESNTCSAQQCGHYTQVVWANTNNLGCGVNRCPTLENYDEDNALILVCNYGPGGNIRGEKPYIAQTTTDAPTTATDAPTNATESPTNATESPTNATESPTNATESPTNATNATESPTNATESPTNATESPTSATTDGQPADSGLQLQPTASMVMLSALIVAAIAHITAT